MRRPRQWAPYHLRLDWLMWFAALAHNPFPDRPPRAVRAVVHLYRFTTWKERRETGAWWVRSRVGDLVPPIGLDDLAERGSSVHAREQRHRRHHERHRGDEDREHHDGE
jgi:hypothetical protein